jgi:hypothetical protein
MEKTLVSGKKLVLIGGTVSVVVLFGVTYAFRTFGWTRFVANAQLQEGKSNVVYMARGVMACAEQSGHLPVSSRTVPNDLAQVGGKPYASTDADWTDEAFACQASPAESGKSWRMRDPQRFQYQWLRTTETTGKAIARGDFNGDGIVEATFEQDVACETRNGKFRCSPGALHDRNH